MLFISGFYFQKVVKPYIKYSSETGFKSVAFTDSATSAGDAIYGVFSRATVTRSAL